jgi:hypothetical protein
VSRCAASDTASSLSGAVSAACSASAASSAPSASAPKPRTVKEKQEAARVLLANLIEVMRGAVKNPVLMVLEPTEFVEAAALSKMWSDRVNQLVSRRD